VHDHDGRCREAWQEVVDPAVGHPLVGHRAVGQGVDCDRGNRHVAVVSEEDRGVLIARFLDALFGPGAGDLAVQLLDEDAIAKLKRHAPFFLRGCRANMELRRPRGAVVTHDAIVQTTGSAPRCRTARHPFGSEVAPVKISSCGDRPAQRRAAEQGIRPAFDVTHPPHASPARSHCARSSST
jgi:hypothetical protein